MPRRRSRAELEAENVVLLEHLEAIRDRIDELIGDDEKADEDSDSDEDEESDD